MLIVDRGRDWHPLFSRSMERLGYASDYSKPCRSDYLLDSLKGRSLRCRR